MARQERALATREAILQAAGIVFADVSYNAAKLSDITKEAKITQGGLYFHFDSKQDLAEQVVKRQEDIVRNGIADELSRNGNRSAYTIIAAAFVFARETMNEPIVRAGLRLNSESPGQFPGFAAKPYLEWVETTRHLLHLGIQQGDVPPDADIAALANIAVEAHTGTQIVSQVANQWSDFGERLDRLYTHVFIPLMFLPEKQKELREAQIQMRKRICPSKPITINRI